MLISFDSLPKHAQDAIGDPRKVNHILERYYRINAEAVEFYTNFQYVNGRYLPLETKEQYIVNASMVEAILSLQKARETERLTKGGSIRGITMSLCYDAISFQEVLRIKHKTKHNLPQNPRRFKEALTKYEAIGFESLIKDIKGRTKQNARKVTADVVKLLNDLFATQHVKASLAKSIPL